MNRSLFFNWQGLKCSDKKAIILNFGPQHPAAHGVLRLVLQLEGEVIQRLDSHIGLLHRGTERLVETKHAIKSIPYFDRLDYVSMMTQEHAFCLAIERILDLTVTNPITLYTRILFDELTRVLNHLLAVACHALDIGSMSSVFWAFEEREKLMEFYERVSGARMHAAFHRPVTQFFFIPSRQLIEDILYFIRECYVTLNEMHNVLTYNKIWKQRLVAVGVISFSDCLSWGLTGVMSRSAGIRRDLRLAKRDAYSGYSLINLKSYLGTNGDTYDRFLIRMLEMGESLSISSYAAWRLSVMLDSTNITNTAGITHALSNTGSAYTSMEDLISHFINWHSGAALNVTTITSYIESPKGEFGVVMMSDSSSTPLRCKIRSPSYFNLQALPKLSKGHFLADLAALIGTIDVVFGEVDR